MFTVKYRDSDGTETLYSAEKVEVEHKGDVWGDGIFLDRDPPSDPDSNDPVTRMSREIILFSHNETAAAEARAGGKVWVMNEAGATVAVYDL